jgi:CBS domain-containing protein
MATDDGLVATSVHDQGARTTVGQVMRPAATTVEDAGHLAGAAYLMKRSGDTALVVTTDEGRPTAIITDADISQAVADGRDLGSTRITDLRLQPPLTVEPGMRVDDAARLMLLRRIHHLPVVDGERLVGLVDLPEVCRALLVPGQGLAPEPRATG